MSKTATPPVTRYDYEQMPEGPPYYQVIEGELVMSPSPRMFHQHIIGNLFAIFRAHLDRNPVGEAFLAPLDVFLSDVNVYQPDVVFLSNERRSFLTDKGIEGPPDLVVEILSDSTARYDKGTKRKVYGQTGVRELWLIDPEPRVIQVFRLPENAETPMATHNAEAVFETPLLPGLRIEAARVFKSPHAG